MKRVDTTFTCDSCSKTTATLPGAINDATLPAGWALLEWKHSLGTSTDMLCNICVAKLKAYMTTFAIQNAPVQDEPSKPHNRRRLTLDPKSAETIDNAQT